jgi:hypothetical protein
VTYDKDSIVFQPIPTDPRFIKLTDSQYNRLTVLGYAGRSPSKAHLWWCECECGTIVCAHGTHLKSGHTRSCGCQKIEEFKARFTSHGHAKKGAVSPEYQAYQHAKCRCNDPDDSSYYNYGGRGIEFRFESFEDFFAEVGLRPEGKTMIDRVDVNGHYEVGNLRWVDDIESAGNTRRNRRLTHNGRTQNVEDWSRELSIKSTTLRKRIKDGWSVEDAFSIPTLTPSQSRSGHLTMKSDSTE